MKTIMVATDFSERSDRALRRATLLAKQFEASLVLVHVVDDDQPRRIADSQRSEADRLLRELATTLRSVDEVNSESRVPMANPFAGIVQAVEASAPDLLVIGRHRRQPFRDVFVGTTAERTIRSVACPVLMVNALPAGRYRHVMQTTDRSDGSRDALQRFAELEIGKCTRTWLLYVFDSPALRLAMAGSTSKDGMENYLWEEHERASRALSAFMASTRAAEAEQIVRHQEKTVPKEILKAAAETEADLIVVATRSRSGPTTLPLGSVAEKLLRISPVDVLVIPPAGGDR